MAQSYFLHDLKTILVFVSFRDLFVVDDHRCTEKEKWSEENSDEQKGTVICVVGIIFLCTDSGSDPGVIRQLSIILQSFYCIQYRCTIGNFCFIGAGDIQTKMNGQILSSRGSWGILIHFCSHFIKLFKIRISDNKYCISIDDIATAGQRRILQPFFYRENRIIDCERIWFFSHLWSPCKNLSIL